MKSIFLVDADDTILDFHGVSAVALKIAFEESGIVWREEFLPAFKKINGGFWEALERKELTRKELMERRFPYYLSYLGLENVDGAAFNEKFISYLSTHTVYLQGAEAFLKTLNGMGRVFIVTNGTEHIQRSRFSLSNLYSYAEDVFISDSIGCDKPAKGYTDYVIEHINGFEREKAVWIGDSLSADIKAANDAGITSVWFDRAEKPPEKEIKPDYIAKNFEEVLEILRKI